MNYLLLGTASGFTLATALAAQYAPSLLNFYGGWAIIIAVAGLFTRSVSLIRNAKLKPASTLNSAIGVRHTKITQRAQGFMGGSFNTREFFHGATRRVFRSIKWVFLVLVFPLPILFLTLGMKHEDTLMLLTAFVVQYIGLIAERWFFFAQTNHPQNLYYQTVG